MSPMGWQFCTAAQPRSEQVNGTFSTCSLVEALREGKLPIRELSDGFDDQH